MLARRRLGFVPVRVQRVDLGVGVPVAQLARGRGDTATTDIPHG
jgi:hypothetical protein